MPSASIFNIHYTEPLTSLFCAAPTSLKNTVYLAGYTEHPNVYASAMRICHTRIHITYFRILPFAINTHHISTILASAIVRTVYATCCHMCTAVNHPVLSDYRLSPACPHPKMQFPHGMSRTKIFVAPYIRMIACRPQACSVIAVKVRSWIKAPIVCNLLPTKDLPILMYSKPGFIMS